MLKTNETNELKENKFKNFFKGKKFKMPSSFAILIGIIIFLILMTWILHWSGVQTTWIENIKPTYDPTTGAIITTQEVSGVINAMGILDVFHVILSSFAKKANLILFILVIGAFVYVVFETKSLEAGIGRLIKKMNGKEIWLIPIIMILFSAGGTTFGMAEESIPFYLILIPVFCAAGFDALTGFLVIMLGCGIGTVGSTLNPFKIPIAVDGINSAMNAEVIQTSTGIAFRAIGYYY